MRRVWACVCFVVAVACAGRGDKPAAIEHPAPTPGVDAGAVDARAAAQDAGPVVSESTARVVLAKLFRDNGLRIREDVRVRGEGYDVTLDGFDPARRVGYEYVDAVERNTDLNGAERAAIAADATVRVLVVDATDAADLVDRATQFLTVSGQEVK